MTVMGAAAATAAAAGFGGVAGTRAFVDAATDAARIHFDTYYPTIEGAEADAKWDAFRHMFVSGALAMASTDGYAHFIGDLYEAWTLFGNTMAERNMDLWNNEIGRTLAANAEDANDLADLVHAAIENEVAIVWSDEDERVYSGQDIKLDPDMIALLRNIEITYIVGEEFYSSQVTWGPWIHEWSPEPSVTIPEFVEDGLVPWGQAPDQASPLTIDIDGDGMELTTFAASTTATFFDIDGDGFAEQTAWVDGDDGLLVRDLDSSGTIDSSAELFGSATIDGFALLASFDLNGDHVINQHDAVWADLLIWKDANEDAITQNGELHTLASLDIVSIDLAGVAPSTSSISGNPITHTSTYRLDNGTNRSIVDAWFIHDNTNTLYAGDYQLDVRTLFLPNLRGFGKMADLHIAMSQNEELLLLVQDFASSWDISRFEDGASLNAEIQEILWTWAGVENEDPWGRQGLGRRLEFIEEFFGSDYMQLGISPDPGHQAATLLIEAWERVYFAMKAQLIVQVGGTELFGNTIAYNSWTGALEGEMELSQSALDDIEAAAPTNPWDLQLYWQQVAEFIHFTKGFENLETAEVAMLESALGGSGATFSWEELTVSSVPVWSGITVTGSPDDDNIWGTIGADTLDGGAGNDSIYGMDGDDQIFGGAGDDVLQGGGHDDVIYGGDGNDTIQGDDNNDILYGGNGNDKLYGVYGDNILYGEAGNDELYGGNGDDILRPGPGGDYAYGGGGNDTFEYESGTAFFEDQAGTDKIILPVGVDAGDLTFHQVATGYQPGSLFITIDALGTIETPFFAYNYGAPAYARIETIEFSDTTTFDFDSLTTFTSYGTEESDYVYGVQFSSHLDDTLYGLGGNDQMFGQDGDDILDGGIGNDFLYGGAGNDTYVVSPGFDVIEDGAGSEVLLIPDGYDISDLSIVRLNSNDIEIRIDGLGQVRLNSQLYYTGDYAIESISFNGVSTLDLLTAQIESIGTAGNDFIVGIMAGASTDDIMDGRDGDDYLQGMDGDDTYYFSLGEDWLQEQSGTDTIRFREDWAPGDISIYRRGADLFLEDGNGNLVKSLQHFTVSAFYDHSQYRIETVEFADSTVWTLAEMEIETRGTSGSESISGAIAGDASVDDAIFGFAGNDSLEAGAGNDLLDGGEGDDSLWGGEGDDTYVAGLGMDYVSELAGGGTDIVHVTGGVTINDIVVSDYASSDATIVIDSGVNEIHMSALRSAWTSDHVEFIRFDDGFITSLPDYASWITGTSGNDVTAGNSSDNTIIGLAGNDTITGAGGNDDAHGGAGEDSLDGGDGNDLLYGGDDDDILYGKAGLDTLHGGDGADTFVFETASAFSDIDVIRDFNVGDDDVLDLTDILDTVYDPLNDAISDFVEFTESSGSTFVSVDRDGTGGTYSMAQIIKLENVTGLASPDTLETNGNLLAA